MNTEPTVEEALRELREMFPDAHPISINHSIAMQGSNRADYATMQADNEGWRDTTLTDCMAQVRQWHQENKQ